MDVRVYTNSKTWQKLKVLASIENKKLSAVIDDCVEHYIQSKSYDSIFEQIEAKSNGQSSSSD